MFSIILKFVLSFANSRSPHSLRPIQCYLTQTFSSATFVKSYRRPSHPPTIPSLSLSLSLSLAHIRTHTYALTHVVGGRETYKPHKHKHYLFLIPAAKQCRLHILSPFKHPRAFRSFLLSPPTFPHTHSLSHLSLSRSRTHTHSNTLSAHTSSCTTRVSPMDRATKISSCLL